MSNELAVNESVEMSVDSSNFQGISWCSLPMETEEDKKRLFNIVSMPDEKLKEHINQELKIEHVFFQEIEMVNKKTGELTIAPRIIFIDDEGTSYSCVSSGIKTSIKNLMSIFGKPPWKPALTIIPKLVNAGEGQILTIKLK
ncbi:MAG: Single-stranded DNA-binding protein [Bacteriophage sp.]|jgi:hypothetical protein|nr:MAG: Single-stranded DNA-binding protein [Bacteriophage sp.]